MINRSVSGLSQILINSKEKISNSLILDKKIKIEKIGIRLRRLEIIVSLASEMRFPFFSSNSR